eukprot:scaffold1340_cov253-Pinguiococcus_pyrenoidosus.AAC.21
MRTSAEMMQMLCATEGPFTVMLFHEVPGGGPLEARQEVAVRDLLGRLRECFRENFLHQVDVMLPQIRAAAESPGGPSDEMLDQIQKPFDGFDEFVEEERSLAFQSVESKKGEEGGTS